MSPLPSQVLRNVRNYHFWVVVAMFIVGAVLHYPQQILTVDSPSLFLFLDLTRYAAARVFLLAPIIYAGFFLGTKGGIASLGVALSIMLPRVIIVSPYPTDALFETVGVISTGSLVNLWFHIHRRDIIQRKRVEEMLTKIIDGSAIPIFAINKQHRVIHWNTALESLSGLKKDEVIGTDKQWMNFYAKKRPILADLIVDGASADGIALYYGDKGRKSYLIEGAYEAEQFFPDIGEDGRWLHLTASPIKDNKGEITGAIETLRDITQQKRLEENSRFYAQQITRAQEEERKRLARELHDDLAQSLLLMAQGLDFLTSTKRKKLSNLHLKQNLEKLRSLTVETLEDLRRYAQDLRPRILDDLGLIAALEWMADDLSRIQGISAYVEIKGVERDLPAETQLLLFRIAQEALTNTRRHAQASEATVKLEFEDNELKMTVIDNGKGFELPARIGDLASIGKLGLAGIQERARLIGGRLNLQSEPGKGTTVTVEVPV